jgi:hypothetical protein
MNPNDKVILKQPFFLESDYIKHGTIGIIKEVNQSTYLIEFPTHTLEIPKNLVVAINKDRL